MPRKKHAAKRAPRVPSDDAARVALPLMAAFWTRVEQELTDRGLDWKDLATASGVGASTLSRKRQGMPFHAALAIAHALRTSVGALVYGVDDSATPEDGVRSKPRLLPPAASASDQSSADLKATVAKFVELAKLDAGLVDYLSGDATTGGEVERVMSELPEELRRAIVAVVQLYRVPYGTAVRTATEIYRSKKRWEEASAPMWFEELETALKGHQQSGLFKSTDYVESELTPAPNRSRKKDG